MTLTDRHGNTVQAVTYRCPDRSALIVRDAAGYLLHGGFGTPDPTTPAEVAALGIDIASLA